MFGLKGNEEIDSYLYKVCEISGCEKESEGIYEDDTKVIGVCSEHDKILNANKWTLW